MIWTKEAEKSIARVPFFVRKKVCKYVEEEAARTGASKVLIGHVEACRKRFLSGGGMEKEVKGYQIETCFGPSGCENSIGKSAELVAELGKILAGRDLPGFLKSRVKGPLKFHHEFRVSVSDCPNACSRPQIVDVGIIGAHQPAVSDVPCSGCRACEQVCAENAVEVAEDGAGPEIDPERCVACGKCVGICPSRTLTTGKKGYRILVGGKLGRHPQLGRELPGIYTEEEVLEIFQRCLDLYFEHNQSGERFGAIINRTGIDVLV